MNKLILAAIAIILMASCSKNSTSKVTVVGKSQNLTWEDKMVGQEYYSVVTPSGDTMKAIVDEEVYLNNSIPYTATMRVNNFAKHGFIEAENNPIAAK